MPDPCDSCRSWTRVLSLRVISTNIHKDGAGHVGDSRDCRRLGVQRTEHALRRNSKSWGKYLPDATGTDKISQPNYDKEHVVAVLRTGPKALNARHTYYSNAPKDLHS